ncbi:MAG: hypothetical protein FJ161_01100 [Gammaproteobacteria bacterium]|nr:hypothetical protein [Gammaproteobacteria bacterium]
MYPSSNHQILFYYYNPYGYRGLNPVQWLIDQINDNNQSFGPAIAQNNSTNVMSYINRLQFDLSNKTIIEQSSTRLGRRISHQLNQADVEYDNYALLKAIARSRNTVFSSVILIEIFKLYQVPALIMKELREIAEETLQKYGNVQYTKNIGNREGEKLSGPIGKLLVNLNVRLQEFDDMIKQPDIAQIFSTHLSLLCPDDKNREKLEKDIVALSHDIAPADALSASSILFQERSFQHDSNPRKWHLFAAILALLDQKNPLHIQLLEGWIGQLETQLGGFGQLFECKDTFRSSLLDYIPDRLDAIPCGPISKDRGIATVLITQLNHKKKAYNQQKRQDVENDFVGWTNTEQNFRQHYQSIIDLFCSEIAGSEITNQFYVNCETYKWVKQRLAYIHYVDWNFQKNDKFESVVEYLFKPVLERLERLELNEVHSIQVAAILLKIIHESVVECLGFPSNVNDLFEFIADYQYAGQNVAPPQPAHPSFYANVDIWNKSKAALEELFPFDTIFKDSEALMQQIRSSKKMQILAAILPVYRRGEYWSVNSEVLSYAENMVYCSLLDYALQKHVMMGPVDGANAQNRTNSIWLEIATYAHIIGWTAPDLHSNKYYNAANSRFTLGINRGPIVLRFVSYRQYRLGYHKMLDNYLPGSVELKEKLLYTRQANHPESLEQTFLRKRSADIFPLFAWHFSKHDRSSFRQFVAAMFCTMPDQDFCNLLGALRSTSVGNTEPEAESFYMDHRIRDDFFALAYLTSEASVMHQKNIAACLVSEKNRYLRLQEYFKNCRQSQTPSHECASEAHQFLPFYGARIGRPNYQVPESFYSEAGWSFILATNYPYLYPEKIQAPQLVANNNEPATLLAQSLMDEEVDAVTHDRISNKTIIEYFAGMPSATMNFAYLVGIYSKTRLDSCPWFDQTLDLMKVSPNQAPILSLIISNPELPVQPENNDHIARQLSIALNACVPGDIVTFREKYLGSNQEILRVIASKGEQGGRALYNLLSEQFLSPLHWKIQGQAQAPAVLRKKRVFFAELVMECSAYLSRQDWQNPERRDADFDNTMKFLGKVLIADRNITQEDIFFLCYKFNARCNDNLQYVLRLPGIQELFNAINALEDLYSNNNLTFLRYGSRENLDRFFHAFTRVQSDYTQYNAAYDAAFNQMFNNPRSNNNNYTRFITNALSSLFCSDLLKQIGTSCADLVAFIAVLAFTQLKIALGIESEIKEGASTPLVTPEQSMQQLLESVKEEELLKIKDHKLTDKQRVNNKALEILGLTLLVNWFQGIFKHHLKSFNSHNTPARRILAKGIDLHARTVVPNIISTELAGAPLMESNGPVIFTKEDTEGLNNNPRGLILDQDEKHASTPSSPR